MLLKKGEAMDGLHLPAPAYGRPGAGQLVWTINYFRGQQIWWPVSEVWGEGDGGVCKVLLSFTTTLSGVSLS